jgi:arabinogalactan oligomer/maltooligosaccharide transport system permease protein
MDTNIPTTVTQPRRRSLRERTLESQSAQRALTVWLIRIVIVTVTLLSLFPTIYVVLVSFKAGESLFTSSILPTAYTLDNYQKLMEKTNFFYWVRSSLIIGTASSLLSVAISTLGGYAISRFRFPGRKNFILGMLIISFLPSTVNIVAIYRMYQVLGLLNKLQGLILLFGIGGGALAVWLLKNYMDSIPKELDEAASIDGAGHFGIFWRILFPLIQPMLVAQFIFVFIGVYNDYVTAAIFLNSEKLYPLGVGTKFFLQDYRAQWSIFSASATLGSLPILAIFFAAQRLLVEGLTKGALKG